MNVKIPNSGQLGNLVKSITEKISDEVSNILFQNYSTLLKGNELAEWVLKMIKKLQNEIGLKETIKIMEEYGRQSCGKGFKNTITNIKKKSTSLEDFINKLAEHYKKSSFFEFIDNNTIISGHYKCYCMIKSASKPIESQTFCHFCVGHSKEFYETALKKPIKIEIIETVMLGGDTCKFKMNF
ncbi:MAG: hypothetical protein JXA99_09115 [Candidatus Lokiarchaeota archaeon]|nr:hypothetical protein [Candidatus Lokiarchaeota archaeon]